MERPYCLDLRQGFRLVRRLAKWCSLIPPSQRNEAMADINPSENVRTMLAETLGRLRKASEEYFGLLEKGLSSSPLPIADQAK